MSEAVNATVVTEPAPGDNQLASAQNPVSTVLGDAAIAESTQASSTWHIPGSALETVADRDANDVVRAEQVAETLPEPTPLYVETQDPVANLLSRSNIVPSGPGSVEDFLPAA